MVHLGAGEWLIVDSCRKDPASPPAGIAYLENLGVDPSSAVKLIVASHWHADHVEGLSDVVRSCPGAEFACSEALGCREFQALAQLEGSSLPALPSGVEELARVLEILGARKPWGGPDHWASENKILFRREPLSGISGCEVWALSPSAASQTVALEEFASLWEIAQGKRRRLPSRSPNEHSVVLWIDLGWGSVILGGDLENTASARRGWNAVLACGAWSGKQARVFKVPHHGSAGAHCEEVWTRMLEEDPIALLTPYVRGGKVVPGPHEVGALRRRTTRLFSTGDPKRWRATRRHKAVEKTLSEMVLRRRSIRGPLGHIQVRWTPVTDPVVRLDGGAIPLD